MAWNEPGGNKPRDPWGGGGNDQGPPDLEEMLKNLRGKFSGAFGGGGSSGGGLGSLLTLLAIGFLVIYVFWASFAVDEQQRGVVLSFGKFDRTVGPGLNWHWPPVESYQKVNTQGTRRYSLREEMLTRDTNIVAVNLEVQYRVVDPETFVLRVQDSEAVLRHAIESALRQVVGASTMDEVLVEERQRIGADVRVRLQEYLDTYNTGIQVVQLLLERTAAPEAVRDAFDDVARAKEDEERFRNEAQAYANGVVPEARGRAQRMREQAEAYREEVVAMAQGDAERFIALYDEYRKAPAVTRERLYLETLQEVYAQSSKVLVDTEAGNNMLYLPLDQLLRNHGGQSSAASQGGANTATSPAPTSSQRSTPAPANSGTYGNRSRELR